MRECVRLVDTVWGVFHYNHYLSIAHEGAKWTVTVRKRELWLSHVSHVRMCRQFKIHDARRPKQKPDLIVDVRFDFSNTEHVVTVGVHVCEDLALLFDLWGKGPGGGGDRDRSIRTVS